MKLPRFTRDELEHCGEDIGVNLPEEIYEQQTFNALEAEHDSGEIRDSQGMTLHRLAL